MKFTAMVRYPAVQEFIAELSLNAKDLAEAQQKADAYAQDKNGEVLTLEVKEEAEL